MKNNLTQGSILKNLLRFSLPYLLSCFLQTFYGLADLFITGQFNGADTITAVSMGSQVTHMLTVIIVGLAMGGTVSISRALGAGDREQMKKNIGNTVILFAGFALALTVILLLGCNGILHILSTPQEAWGEARRYLMICYVGIPFITAYNVISSIYRGMGDSKSPMYFVAIAGVINVALDYLLIGPFHMGAAGAAVATVTAQAISVIIALIAFAKMDLGFVMEKTDFRIHKAVMQTILKIGVPIAVQDGFIQVAFLVITIIANRRGVDVAAAVGIVEKIICFMFLVPSAMLSTVSAIVAQNAGAELHERGKKTLFYGIGISVAVGIVFTVICQFGAETIVGWFTKGEPQVVILGAQYLRSYVFDCIVAGIHFCFSGYFCAYQKSMISFVHNLASILLVRIPGAYLSAIWFPATLFPMGLAAPLGSLFSAIICYVVFIILQKRNAFA